MEDLTPDDSKIFRSTKTIKIDGFTFENISEELDDKWTITYICDLKEHTLMIRSDIKDRWWSYVVVGDYDSPKSLKLGPYYNPVTAGKKLLEQILSGQYKVNLIAWFEELQSLLNIKDILE